MSFNRPQAIRCLATPRQSMPDRVIAPFQSPAGDSLSCDQVVFDLIEKAGGLFQSPAGDSLSCDRALPMSSGCRPQSFNRPQAIRCLATRRVARTGADPDDVSIARRRFVVLRPPAFDEGRGCPSRFNRPQAIRCLATPSRGPAARTVSSLFQSPAGDSLSCDRAK